ncbi:MAG TPA: hypothetical protein VHU80_07625, partial [Polyangiaceae bacterium]|nr:hypothetical protein [Polyangiaceae bacterium]
VWDHSSAHPICDAKVVAESEDGSVTTFSPCYQAYLGSGTWKVTASKPGLPVAIGTVTVSKERKCSRPTFHSLELTLGIDASVESAPQPAAPRAPIPPSPSPPPASSVPATAPAGSPAAPSSTVPAAAFPSEQPPPAATDVPAPPTR